MKKIYCYFLGIMLTAGFSACTSENELVVDNAKVAKSFTVSIPASFADADTRAVELIDGGSYLKAFFKEGDQVRIFKTDNNGKFIPISDLVTISSTGTSTTLTGTLSGDYQENDILLLSYDNSNNPLNKFPAYKYEAQRGTFDSASGYDFAYATVKVESVDKEAGTIQTEVAHFKNLQSFFLLSFVDETGSQISAKSVKIDSSKTFASYVEPQGDGSNKYYFENYRVFLTTASNNVWVVMTVNEEATEDDNVEFLVEDNEGFLYTGTKTAHVGEIKNGKYYGAEIKLTPTGQINNLKVKPESNYQVSTWGDQVCYQITGDVEVSGTGYYYFIQAANKSNNITITLNNVNMTNNNLLFENEESSNQEVTVVLVGDNIMNNENANSVGIRLRHGKSTKFTGTGTLVIKNSDFDPTVYEDNVIFDGLKATYDAETNTTTIKPTE